MFCPQCQLKETAACWELVADSRRRGVDLLYSNMHTLLPLPLAQLPVSTLPPLQTPSQPCLGPMDLSTTTTTSAPSARSHLDAPPARPAALQLAEAADDGSPLKVSQRMRKHKRLAERDPLRSDSDSEDGFLSLAEPVAPTRGKEEEEGACKAEAQDPRPPPPSRMKREPLTPQQRAISAPVSRCLAAIADFLDAMSYADVCSASPQGGGRGAGGRGPYGVRPGARVKDGMVDEARLESPKADGVEAERAVEIQAAVEALSFRRCLAGVTEAQTEAQALGGGGELGEKAALELSLPVALHQRGFSLTPHPPCQPK